MEQRSPVPARPAGKRKRQHCQDPRNCRVCSRSGLTPVSTASVKLHCCKSSREIGRPGLSCVKPSWFCRRLSRSAAPETGDTSSLSLSCISVMLLVRVVWLDCQHSFFSLGISLLPPSLENPERAASSHCADKKQDLGKQQSSSCFVAFQLNLTLRCTLPLLLLQNLSVSGHSSWMSIWGKGA